MQLISTAAEATAAPHEGHRRRRRHASRGRGYFRGWRQALLDTVYLLTGFALAIAWWTLLVTLIATGLGLAVTLVGLPILAATTYLWTLIADTERWRARVLLGLDVARPYLEGTRGSDPA